MSERSRSAPLRSLSTAIANEIRLEFCGVDDADYAFERRQRARPPLSGTVRHGIAILQPAPFDNVQSSTGSIAAVTLKRTSIGRHVGTVMVAGENVELAILRKLLPIALFPANGIFLNRIMRESPGLAKIGKFEAVAAIELELGKSDLVYPGKSRRVQDELDDLHFTAILERSDSSLVDTQFQQFAREFGQLDVR